MWWGRRHVRSPEGVQGHGSTEGRPLKCTVANSFMESFLCARGRTPCPQPPFTPILGGMRKIFHLGAEKFHAEAEGQRIWRGKYLTRRCGDAERRRRKGWIAPRGSPSCQREGFGRLTGQRGQIRKGNWPEEVMRQAGRPFSAQWDQENNLVRLGSVCLRNMRRGAVRVRGGRGGRQRGRRARPAWEGGGRRRKGCRGGGPGRR